jgi:hypothetical protein
LWVIFVLLDPDPATQINADPCGSGSETLLSFVGTVTSITILQLLPYFNNYNFNPNQCCESALVSIRIRIHHFRKMLIRIQFQGFYDPIFFYRERRPSYRRSLETSKENIQLFKT